MKQWFMIAAVLGVIDPNCTMEKICTPGYTDTVRPSNFYTRNLKMIKMDVMGLAGKPSDFELDHQVPLECGGAPRDPENLWPEPWPEAREKDKLETRLHRCACQGQITLQQCQHTFLGDWEKALERMKAGEKCPTM